MIYEENKLLKCQKDYIINRIWSNYDENAIEYVCEKNNLFICLNIKDLKLKDLYRLDEIAINSLLPYCNKCNHRSIEFNHTYK